MEVPQSVAKVGIQMARVPCVWSLCGGWAVDVWLGRETREHLDVDVACFRDDEQTLYRHLAGWKLIAHDTDDADHSIPWDGHPLRFPAHLHAGADDPPKREVQLNEREGDTWLLNREPRVMLPVERFALSSPLELPVMAPEAVLFYKSLGTRRAHDEHDFDELLPVLHGDRRDWLAASVAALDADHPWLQRLS